jgi:hypothetical protein
MRKSTIYCNSFSKRVLVQNGRKANKFSKRVREGENFKMGYRSKWVETIDTSE